MSHVNVANNIGRKFVDTLIHFWQDLLPIPDTEGPNEVYQALWALHDALNDWCLEDGVADDGMYAIWPHGPVATNPWTLINKPTRLLQRAAKYLMETYPEDRGWAIQIGMAAYRFRSAMKRAWLRIKDDYSEPDPFHLWNQYYVSVEQPIISAQVPPIITYPSLPQAVQAPTEFFLRALNAIRAWPSTHGFRTFDTLQRAIWSTSEWPYPVDRRRLYEELLDHDWYAEFYGTRYVLLLEPIVEMISRQPADKKTDLYTKLFETVIDTMDKPHWSKMLALPSVVEGII